MAQRALWQRTRLNEEDAEKPAERGGLLMRQLLRQRTLMIAKPIDRQLMEKVASMLVVLEADDPERDVTVYVNSPGGDADSGFAIFDLLRFCRPQVRTICAGLAASAAVPIFLAGAKGMRFALPHARFLLHQPSMQMMGQATDLEITATEITRIRQRYNELVSNETGKDLETVRKDADRDFWLSAQEAVDYGLVDRIIRERAEID